MTDFLAANWLWIVLIVFMVVMHRGHGGHGGHGRRDSERQADSQGADHSAHR